MSTFGIAVANLRFAASPEESVELAEQAIDEAAIKGAGLICFPECFVPGYRGLGKQVPPPDSAFLDRAWLAIAAAAGKAKAAIILGSERLVPHGLLATALVIKQDGTIAGFQDKVQLDPSEELTYSPGSGRQVFQIGSLTFGIVICHEGWRYRKPCAGWFVTEHRSCSTPIFILPNPAVTYPHASPIQKTRFMRKQCYVAPPRTPATSHR